MALVRDFKQTLTGEWDTSGGDFGTVADAAAVPQGIKIRLGMILGEVFLDESIGVDWIDGINVAGADPLVVRGLLAAAIASTPDVKNVNGSQLVVDTATREARVSYAVDTVYSQNTLADAIIVGP